MATITLNVADAQLQRVIDGLCGAENLTPTGANAKLALVRIAKRTVRIHEEVIAQLNIEEQLDIT